MEATLETFVQTKFTSIRNKKVTNSLDKGRNSKYSALLENLA
jgi:hypothetical protein